MWVLVHYNVMLTAFVPVYCTGSINVGSVPEDLKNLPAVVKQSVQYMGSRYVTGKNYFLLYSTTPITANYVT